MSGLTERLWPGVVQTFTADGTVQGLVTVADSAGFYVNQIVHIISLTQASTSYKVKRVISPTQLFVGDPSKSIDSRLDISRFLVADNAQIIASEQRRPEIAWEYVLRHVYAEEPSVALRVLQVDQYGEPIGPGGVASDINVAKWGNIATSLGQKSMTASVPVVIASDQMVLSNSVIKKQFDYVLPAYPNPTTEQYTYLAGGLSGVPVGLVTIVYTDATKVLMASFDVVNY